MKFYLVLDYTLPSMSPKSTQVEIHNDGGSLGLVMSFKTLSRLSHLIEGIIHVFIKTVLP